jgi:hypothetical protein
MRNEKSQTGPGELADPKKERDRADAVGGKWASGNADFLALR